MALLRLFIQYFVNWLNLLDHAGMRRDHGDYALDRNVRPNSREILDLCPWPPRLHPRPVSEVAGIEAPEALQALQAPEEAGP